MPGNARNAYGRDGDVTDVAIIQGITFLTVIAGFAYQAYRETRQRRWVIEDRKVLAATVIKVAATAEQLVLEKADELHAAIKENTEISTQAFHEANGVKETLVALGLEHNLLQGEQLRADLKRDKK